MKLQAPEVGVILDNATKIHTLHGNYILLASSRGHYVSARARLLVIGAAFIVRLQVGPFDLSKL